MESVIIYRISIHDLSIPSLDRLWQDYINYTMTHRYNTISSDGIDENDMAMELIAEYFTLVCNDTPSEFFKRWVLETHQGTMGGIYPANSYIMFENEKDFNRFILQL